MKSTEGEIEVVVVVGRKKELRALRSRILRTQSRERVIYL